MPLSSEYERVSVRKPYILSKFTGWNDDKNNAALLDTDLRIAENAVLENANLLRSRYGYVLENTTSLKQDSGGTHVAGAVRGIFDMIIERGATHRVIACVGDDIYDNTAADTWTEITNAAVGPKSCTTPGTSADHPFTACSFKDKLIMVNPGSVPLRVPRTGDVVDLPSWYADDRAPRYVHTQFNHVFVAGYATGSSPTNTLNPMTVNHSEHQDDEVWLETNVVDKVGGMGSYGDEYVTALFRHRDFLMIGTNKRIYPCSFTGSTFGRFAVHRPLEVGVADQRAVISINGEYTFFMDPDGDIHSIRETAESFGDLGSVSLSNKIANHIRQLNPARISLTHGGYWKSQGLLFWCVSLGLTQSTHNEMIVLDINKFPLNEPDHRAAVWFRWKTVAANCSAMLRRNSAVLTTPTTKTAAGYEVPAFGNTTGFVKRFNTSVSYDEGDDGTDAGFATKAYTKFYDFGDPDHQKAVVEAHWTMQPSSLKIGPQARINYDFNRGYSDTVVVDLVTNVGEYWTLGSGTTNPFILGISRLGGTENTARSKDAFLNGGVFASLELWQRVESTIKWKLQFVTLIVEQRGDVPEIG